jgi:hypothetical protein
MQNELNVSDKKWMTAVTRLVGKTGALEKIDGPCKGVKEWSQPARAKRAIKKPAAADDDWKTVQKKSKKRAGRRSLKEKTSNQVDVRNENPWRNLEVEFSQASGNEEEEEEDDEEEEEESEEESNGEEENRSKHLKRRMGAEDDVEEAIRAVKEQLRRLEACRGGSKTAKSAKSIPSKWHEVKRRTNDKENSEESEEDDETDETSESSESSDEEIERRRGRKSKKSKYWYEDGRTKAADVAILGAMRRLTTMEATSTRHQKLLTLLEAIAPHGKLEELFLKKPFELCYPFIVLNILNVREIPHQVSVVFADMDVKFAQSMTALKTLQEKMAFRSKQDIREVLDTISGVLFEAGYTELGLEYRELRNLVAYLEDAQTNISAYTLGQKIQTLLQSAQVKYERISSKVKRVTKRKSVKGYPNWSHTVLMGEVTAEFSMLLHSGERARAEMHRMADENAAAAASYARVTGMLQASAAPYYSVPTVEPRAVEQSYGNSFMAATAAVSSDGQAAKSAPPKLWSNGSSSNVSSNSVDWSSMAQDNIPKEIYAKCRAICFDFNGNGCTHQSCSRLHNCPRCLGSTDANHPLRECANASGHEAAKYREALNSLMTNARQGNGRGSVRGRGGRRDGGGYRM